MGHKVHSRSATIDHQKTQSRPEERSSNDERSADAGRRRLSPAAEPTRRAFPAPCTDAVEASKSSGAMAWIRAVVLAGQSPPTGGAKTLSSNLHRRDEPSAPHPQRPQRPKRPFGARGIA
uniref:Uncharacterized protein n=1 Tax=Odontella aurita TaxID=265563 RepID=A0A7S4J1Z0_9STRA